MAGANTDHWDLRRDLAADLARLEDAHVRGVLLPWHPGQQRAHLAALRRWAAADAECERLRGLLSRAAEKDGERQQAADMVSEGAPAYGDGCD